MTCVVIAELKLMGFVHKIFLCDKFKEVRKDHNTTYQSGNLNITDLDKSSFLSLKHMVGQIMKSKTDIK